MSLAVLLIDCHKVVTNSKDKMEGIVNVHKLINRLLCLFSQKSVINRVSKIGWEKYPYLRGRCVVLYKTRYGVSIPVRFD